MKVTVIDCSVSGHRETYYKQFAQTWAGMGHETSLIAPDGKGVQETVAFQPVSALPLLPLPAGKTRRLQRPLAESNQRFVGIHVPCSFPFRYICPELYRKQGKAKLHRSLQTPRAPGQRPRFDAASPSRHSGCRIRMLFMDTLAHPITNQRYSPHTHGKCTEKASFFIPTNRQRRKGCDKKEVIG